MKPLIIIVILGIFAIGSLLQGGSTPKVSAKPFQYDTEQENDFDNQQDSSDSAQIYGL